MRSIKYILFISLLSACNTQDNNKTIIPSTETKIQSSVTDCYNYTNKGDTIVLTTINNSNKITGTLIYKLKEKDKNEGSINGSMKNDILIADYNFMSEGVTSTRQVAFKLNNNSFTEGFGETTQQDANVRFKNTDSLNYNSKIKLVKTDCQ